MVCDIRQHRHAMSSCSIVFSLLLHVSLRSHRPYVHVVMFGCVFHCFLVRYWSALVWLGSVSAWFDLFLVDLVWFGPVLSGFGFSIGPDGCSSELGCGGKTAVVGVRIQVGRAGPNRVALHPLEGLGLLCSTGSM